MTVVWVHKPLVGNFIVMRPVVEHEIDGTIHPMIASCRTEVYKSSLSMYDQLVVSLFLQEDEDTATADITDSVS